MFFLVLGLVCGAVGAHQVLFGRDYADKQTGLICVLLGAVCLAGWWCS